MPKSPPPKEHQFKPGAEWKGNRLGRPKKRPITDLLEQQIEKAAPNGEKVAVLVAKAWLKAVLKGDTAALKEMLNRLEGKQALVVTADITTHVGPDADEAELDSLLDAIGYTRTAGAIEAPADPGHAGGNGNVHEPGPLENGAAPGAVERPSNGHRNGKNPPAPGDNASAPR